MKARGVNLENLHFFANGFCFKGNNVEINPILVSANDLQNAIKNKISSNINGSFVEKWMCTIQMACLGREFLP